MRTHRLHRLTPVLLLLAAAALSGCDEKALMLLDRTAPEVTITSPAPDADVSGVAFRVAVDATDDEGVDRVVFRVDGTAPMTDTVAPFSASIVTLASVSGTQLVVNVEAFDVAGNSASSSVVVTVSPRSVQRLTSDVNDDMNPSWSPDGSRLAFQADRDGAQFDLWVMNADGSSQTRLTQDVNEDRNPAWSPDGDWIAFDSDRAGGFDVWKLPVATGEADAEPLTSANNDDIQPAWSPDGMYVYFASSRGTTADFNIWRMLATGDDVATTTQSTAFPEDDTAPAISPSGSVLAFSSSLNFMTEHVYTQEVGEVQVFPLTGDVGFTELDPAWSPDGNVVIFSRNEGLDSNLWVMPPGALVPVQVSFGSGAIGDGGAAWSPSGDRIAFHSDRDGNLDIFLIE